jgi:hypothetical protein
MFAQPHNNDFLALIDWHTEKALDRARRAVSDVRGEAARHGAINSSRAVINSFEAVRKEFDSGVESVLGELKRVIRTTTLDRNDLRQLAVQRLTNFAAAAQAIAQTPEASAMGMGDYLRQQFAAMNQYLQFSIRQFDVGFFIPAEPEVPPVAGNSIVIGNMTGSTIQQGSPGAKQSVEITLNVEEMRKALEVFEAGLAASTVPREKIDQLTAELETIRAQLKKPSPSRLILREAGKSIRNIVEGVIGGMLAPEVMNAATVLWSVPAIE